MSKTNYNEEKTEQTVRQHAVVSHDTMKPEETDPEGLPIHRQLSKQADEVTPTSPGVAVESAKSPKESGVQEYRQPARRLPDQISQKEVAAKAATYGGGQ